MNAIAAVSATSAATAAIDLGFGVAALAAGGGAVGVSFGEHPGVSSSTRAM